MRSSPPAFKIGEIARSCGITVETVRFYEKEGLLPKPRRRPSGYRVYTGDAARRLRFIQSAKTLGFSLQEIRELLALRVASGSSCAHVRTRATAKIAELDAKLTELTRVREALVRLAAACTGTGPAGACPLLDALESDEDPRAQG